MRIALKYESYPGSGKILTPYISDPKINGPDHPGARPLLETTVRNAYDSNGKVWPEITIMDFDHK